MKFPALLPILLAATLVSAGPLTLEVKPLPPAAPTGFTMGTAKAPNGSTLSLDSRSLLLDGRRWTPVMGEFHFSRYPASEWRTELAKMKAGGIDIVATYLFWIYHEETEGAWNWSENRNLRAFLEAAAAENLKVIVRLGPWCHGEVRNGGLPDWIVARGNVRSDDAAYLASVRVLYEQASAQCRGLLWKDGGPVIGVQLENEYPGPAEHLLTLKRMARDAGFDVPLYTRTGWPALKTPMPFGEIVPLYGAYAEGFWDRETTAMPGRYWSAFHFSTLRTDANIANEALGRRDVQDSPDVAKYPYLTCEIGGGMMSSYHRRIRVDPREIFSLALVKLGSGSVSPGYYMYHGGTNATGRTTLMEAQDTAMTNWNDLPVKNYDFQAPLGQYGQERPHYRTLRRLHYFLHDFGAQLAELGTTLPDDRPSGKDDLNTLRWSVRGGDAKGFLFVNNYERGRTLLSKANVQFAVKFPGAGTITLPARPATIPEGAMFIWPLNLDLGAGKLVWSTAQSLAVVGAGAEATWYFYETPGVSAEFVFRDARVTIPSRRAQFELLSDGSKRVHTIEAGREPVIRLDSTIRIVLLSEADSLAFLRDPRTGAVRFEETPRESVESLAIERIHPAGLARDVKLGRAPKPVAAAPTDADFAAAAVWRIKIPSGLRPETHPLLRLNYAGDVARVFVDGELVNDDFYNGAPLEIGLWRHPTALRGGEVTVAILPLARASVTGATPKIYFSSPPALPAFGEQEAVAELRAAELIRSTAQPD